MLGRKKTTSHLNDYFKLFSGPMCKSSCVTSPLNCFLLPPGSSSNVSHSVGGFSMTSSLPNSSVPLSSLSPLSQTPWIVLCACSKPGLGSSNTLVLSLECSSSSPFSICLLASSRSGLKYTFLREAALVPRRCDPLLLGSHRSMRTSASLPITHRNSVLCTHSVSASSIF